MTDRLCIVCGRDLDGADRQTCVRCLGRTRRNLLDIVDMYALLPDEILGRAGAAAPMDASGVRGEAETPLPGGDALVMLADGAVSRTYARRLLHAADDSHAEDEWESDPQSILAELGGWEDDWWITRRADGFPRDPEPARPASVAQSVDWLDRRLTWAAQHHDAFDEFARAIRHLAARLAAVVGSGEAVERGAPCPYCGGRIIRRYDDADPCEPGCAHDGDGHDQGGRRDDWVCSNRDCGQRFDDNQHRFAIWQHAVEQGAAS